MLRAMLLAAGLAFAGCQTAGPQGIIGPPGAVPSGFAAQSDAEKRRMVEEWGRLYDRHPDDKETALTYAKGLRALAEYAQAAAVLQRAAIKFPQDNEVLGAYGKALADTGRLREAAEVLARAHTPDRPNWSILSAQGSVADRLGDHEQAQAYYAAALKIAPAQPFVLSNLGLSYALSKKLPEAEKTLKEAASQQGADSRVRQNLALVLSLEGKFASAGEVARRDLTPKDAAANVAAIKRMIAQSNTWKQIQALDARPHAAGMQPGQTGEVSSE
ncbi:MAG: tetratricopeptide repeat protein [Methylocapsa sp.]|nr:tetratricopeptide repeat protein [Methylocapsa sp.]